MGGIFMISAMEYDEFVRLVAKAVGDLPQEFLDRLENVDVVAEDYPTSEQLDESGLEHDTTLLGLYEGVPQTERTSGYGMVLPDKITLFQKPIEAKCRSVGEVYTEVKRTLRHEVAHHFGISDKNLRKLEG